MNNIAINTIIKSEDHLTAKAAAVLHNLALHSNKNNECFPALKTIARECRLSLRTVQRALDELLSAGIITKKHNYRPNGSQTSNIYKIITAVAERAAAIEQNAMLKMRDLKKRMEYALARKNQFSAFSAINPSISEEKKTSHGRLHAVCILKGMIKNITGMLKNSHLTRGDSQTAHPGTQQINY